MKKRALIIANGYLPKIGKIKKLKKIGFNDIICADGGANNIYKLKLLPLYIIGDLDSVRSEVLKYYELKQCKIVKITNQDNTDIEKAIDFLIELGYSELVIFGATGDRIDHTIGNISILIKYSDKLKIHFVHYNSILSCYSGKKVFKTEVGEIISFYGLTEKTTFTTEGLKYNLLNENLYIGFRESTSNVAEKDEIYIQSKEKYLFVRNFDKACKYDFIM